MKPQKVCNLCFQKLQPLQAFLASTSSKAALAPDFEEATVEEWVLKAWHSIA
jgi:hypothetical protein